MTSTSFNVGITGEEKLTSRVLKPPGGGHTDIFGVHDSNIPQPKKSSRQQPKDDVSKTSDKPSIEEPLTVVTSNGSNCENGGEHSVESPESSPTIQQQLQEPEKAPEPEKPKVEVPKRVRVPPGGFSSGLW